LIAIGQPLIEYRNTRGAADPREAVQRRPRAFAFAVMIELLRERRDCRLLAHFAKRTHRREPHRLL
jgi:hypothetical protein